MTRFDGKTCIVAGGARGIGAETSTRYVQEGGKVLVGDVNENLGRELVERLGDDRADFVALDVADDEQCNEAVEHAVQKFGGVDHLVNCAIAMRPGPLVELSESDWRAVVDVGLTGTFLMCRRFGSWMLANQREGAVVNVTSIAAHQPYSGAGPYSTVKAAVSMLTTQLGLEWATDGIRVNGVAPGQTDTPLVAYLKDPEIRRARTQVIPVRRIAEPSEIAAAILYLLSDDASYVTATELTVDGGLSRSLYNHLPGRSFED